MGRSVSFADNSEHIAYSHIDDCEDWEYLCEDFQREMIQAFPSLSECDEWVGREDRALLENSYCRIGVSEYCGLVSMWAQPKDPDYYEPSGWDARRDHWVAQIGPKFHKVSGTCFGQPLNQVGRFSNGEAIFQPANGQHQGGTGLGY